MSAKEELVRYIESLTPDQLEKIARNWERLAREIKEGQK